MATVPSIIGDTLIPQQKNAADTLYPEARGLRGEPVSDERKHSRWRVYDDPQDPNQEIHEFDPKGLSPDEADRLYDLYMEGVLGNRPFDRRRGPDPKVGNRFWYQIVVPKMRPGV